MLGEGILKGLAETAKNFFGSYFSAERLTTVQYPEQRIAPVEATRDFPFLVYDGEDWEAGLRCVACQICEKECPPKCIYIEKSMIRERSATQLSCMEHGMSSLHSESPLAHCWYGASPSSASTISSRRISLGSTRRAKPPVGPLLERSRPLRASCCKIFARK